MNNVLFETSCTFNQRELIEPTKYICTLKSQNKKSIIAFRIAKITIIFAFFYKFYELYTQSNSNISLYSGLTSSELVYLIILFFIFIIVSFQNFIFRILFLNIYNKIFKFPNKYLITANSLSFKFYPPNKEPLNKIILFENIKKIILFDSNLLAVIYDDSNDYIFLKITPQSDIYSYIKEMSSSHSISIENITTIHNYS